MLYAVGTKIDLRDATQSHIVDGPKRSYDTHIPGTKISFLKMAEGLIVMNVNEPPIQLRVALHS